MSRHSVNEVSKVDASGREDDSTEEIDEDHKSHTETTETAQVLQEDELSQVVDGRIDPSSSLRQENGPCFWSRSAGIGIRYKLVRHCWEVFGHQGCQISILTKRQEILLVKRIDFTISIFRNYLV